MKAIVRPWLRLRTARVVLGVLIAPRSGESRRVAHGDFATPFKREALLNTPGMTFLKLDWADATAQCRVCGDCGYIHWFLAEK